MSAGVRITLVTLAAASFSVAAFAAEVPDDRVTPGTTNPAVTQDNIDQTICRRGWTRHVRPLEGYTERLKREQLYTPGSPYFAPRTRLGAFEEDHRIPLNLGGSPYDRRNLWPEPRFSTWGAERKDELEGFVHDLVCRGRLTLDQGRAAFLGDWTEVYRRYFGEPQRANVTGVDHVASARARDQRDLLAPPLPSPVEPPATAKPTCAWVWHPTAFGRGPWVFKTCP